MARMRGRCAVPEDLRDAGDDEESVSEDLPLVIGIEEVWADREIKRSRQIKIGKARPEYELYRDEVPLWKRTSAHPQTPDSSLRISKRAFDRQLSNWRRHLHVWYDEKVGATGRRLPDAPDSAGDESPSKAASAAVCCNGGSFHMGAWSQSPGTESTRAESEALSPAQCLGACSTSPLPGKEAGGGCGSSCCGTGHLNRHGSASDCQHRPIQLAELVPLSRPPQSSPPSNMVCTASTAGATPGAPGIAAAAMPQAGFMACQTMPAPFGVPYLWTAAAAQSQNPQQKQQQLHQQQLHQQHQQQQQQQSQAAAQAAIAQWMQLGNHFVNSYAGPPDTNAVVAAAAAVGAAAAAAASADGCGARALGGPQAPTASMYEAALNAATAAAQAAVEAQQKAMAHFGQPEFQQRLHQHQLQLQQQDLLQQQQQRHLLQQAGSRQQALQTAPLLVSQAQQPVVSLVLQQRLPLHEGEARSSSGPSAPCTPVRDQATSAGLSQDAPATPPTTKQGAKEVTPMTPPPVRTPHSPQQGRTWSSSDGSCGSAQRYGNVFTPNNETSGSSGERSGSSYHQHDSWRHQGTPSPQQNRYSHEALGSTGVSPCSLRTPQQLCGRSPYYAVTPLPVFGSCGNIGGVQWQSNSGTPNAAMGSHSSCTPMLPVHFSPGAFPPQRPSAHICTPSSEAAPPLPRTGVYAACCISPMPMTTLSFGRTPGGPPRAFDAGYSYDTMNGASAERLHQMSLDLQGFSSAAQMSAWRRDA